MSHVNTQQISMKQNSLSKRRVITHNNLNQNFTPKLPNQNQINHQSNNTSRQLNLNKTSQLISAIEQATKLNNIKPIGYIIELGSNENANKHLAQARHQLSKLCQQSIWSTAFVNPDYTATDSNPKPDYTNQCGLLKMAAEQKRYGICDLTLMALIKKTKDIENKIAQDFLATQASLAQAYAPSFYNSSNRQVLIDIDVLAIVTTDGVVALAERYPFKHHEWVGINELYSKGCFTEFKIAD